MTRNNRLLSLWLMLAKRPGGAWLFGQMLVRKVRYTGSIRPRIRELAPGHARISMADRAAVRNHLRSIHAIALMNLGEATGGLALLAALPDDRRGIVTNLSMEYLKKARGPLLGRADFPPPAPDFEGVLQTKTEIVDRQGDVVAIASAEWTLGPAKP